MALNTSDFDLMQATAGRRGPPLLPPSRPWGLASFRLCNALCVHSEVPALSPRPATIAQLLRVLCVLRVLHRPQPTKQTWTVHRQDGPKHLRLAVCGARAGRVRQADRLRGLLGGWGSKILRRCGRRQLQRRGGEGGGGRGMEGREGGGEEGQCLSQARLWKHKETAVS